MQNRARKQKSPLHGALLDNPVLVQAVGLTPVIIVTASLRASLWVALLTAIHLISCEFIASMWLKKLPDWLRIAVYFSIGLAIVLPAGLLFELRDNIELTTLRAILPMLAVSTLSAARCERFAIFNSVGASLRDALANSAGFAAVIILMGVIREGLGHGALFGWEFSSVMQIRGFWMPFGGFLLLGALAAALKIVLQWMSDRGIAVGAEEAMEMVPEDRIERLEKIQKLLRAAEQYEQEREQEPESREQDAGPEEEIEEEAKDASTYSPEEKERLNRALEELLEDFQGGKRHE